MQNKFLFYAQICKDSSSVVGSFLSLSAQVRHLGDGSLGFFENPVIQAHEGTTLFCKESIVKK